MQFGIIDLQINVDLLSLYSVASKSKKISVYYFIYSNVDKWLNDGDKICLYHEDCYNNAHCFSERHNYLEVRY